MCTVSTLTCTAKYNTHFIPVFRTVVVVVVVDCGQIRDRNVHSADSSNPYMFDDSQDFNDLAVLTAIFISVDVVVLHWCACLQCL